MKANGLVLFLARVINAQGKEEPLFNHEHQNLALLGKFAVDGNGNLVFDTKQVLGVQTSTLVLGNNWVTVDAANPARVIRSGNVVRLEGSIKNGTTTSNTVVATLPVGFRPLRTQIQPVWTSGNVVGYATINTSGQVLATLFKSASTSLDSLSFIAA
jgi:hypothetical protein